MSLRLIGVLAGFALCITTELVACKQAGPTIVFLGDSITEAGYFVEGIHAGWHSDSRVAPKQVVTLGLSGETVSGLSEPQYPGVRPVVFARLDAVLQQYHPEWVVVCYGMNCGVFHPFARSRFEAFQCGMQRLIEKVKQAGARLVILIPPPFAKPGRIPSDADSPEARIAWVGQAHAEARCREESDPRRYGYYAPYAFYDEVLAVYSDWLSTLADREHVWVVDLRTPLLERRSEAYGDDPVHPNRQGHRIMAETFLKAWPEIAGNDERRKTGSIRSP